MGRRADPELPAASEFTGLQIEQGDDNIQSQLLEQTINCNNEMTLNM